MGIAGLFHRQKIIVVKINMYFHPRKYNFAHVYLV